MKRYLATLPLSIIAASMILFSCTGPARMPVGREPAPTGPEGTGPVVRVLVLETGDKLRIDLSSADITVMREDGVETGRFGAGGTLTAKVSSRGRKLSRGGRILMEGVVFGIDPADNSGFRLDSVPYRGGLILRHVGSGKLAAINMVSIDDYIKGVLPSEIGHLGPRQYEAYRAQAIASRSYALSKLEDKKGEIFDLRATIMDQVYKGKAGENAEGSRAVDETRGEVGLWEGQPIKAYYSSCCGGHTADIRIGWPWKAHYPYLYGGRDAETADGRSFCRDSRNFRWEVRWSGEELVRILRKTLPAELGSRVSAFRKILDIGVDGVSRSGRAKVLKITTDSGTYRIEGDRIRWVLRPESPSGPILKSTLFKMKVERGGGRVRSVKLLGGGNGHGIGMCQMGAIEMAERGRTGEEILLHYYPGITIKRIY